MFDIPLCCADVRFIYLSPIYSSGDRMGGNQIANYVGHAYEKDSTHDIIIQSMIPTSTILGFAKIAII